MKANAKLGYEQAKRRAGGNRKVRRRLAADPGTQPEILYFLAEDKDVAVRREVARNDSTPWQAARMLDADRDKQVRLALVEKLARLMPTLSAEQRTDVYRQTAETLESLARDQISHVREILASALKDVTDAPADVIRRLARDEDLSVCGPILECSPVLTDEDLLEIIECTTTVGTHAAISRRSQVSATVSDAIVKTGDSNAIADLLDNKSAQIREETLDHIIAQANDKPQWHVPLVRRPKLSSSAVLRIAGFVADKLLEELNNRLDLDDAARTALADVVQRRLQDAAEAPSKPQRQLADPNWASANTDSKSLVVELQRTGKLREETVADALLSGDKRFATAALAIAAELSDSDVARLLSAHNPKSIVALVWKAGFSMDLAIRLQLQMAGIPPAKTLRARPDGDYPLSVAEMEWQLEFVLG